MTGVTAAGQQTAESIKRAAAASFAAHGYEATSLRDVASAVGIKVGSLYNHISSKEDLLLSIMSETMGDLESRMERALSGRDDPLDRLIAFIECHIRFHAERAQNVFIGNSEIRSLHGTARDEISGRRRAYRKELEDLIVAAADHGSAGIINPRLHAFSIVAIGTHVSGWYRPGGGLSLEEIIQTYTRIILRSLGVTDADQYLARPNISVANR